MNDLISNILRGSVSSIMYVILLLTLTKTKLDKKSTILVATFVFVIHMTSTIWFYVYGNLTSLSRFNVLLFIVVGLAIKPLTRLNFMQWSFTFLTTINIGMMIIILSFHLERLFPYPQYANIILRFILYLIVIFLFRRYFITSYRSAVDNWPMFSALMVCIFLNLSYYFYVTKDIKNTLTVSRTPLLLLVMLSLSAYGTVFYSLKKFMELHSLKTENVKIQQETGRLHETAIQLEQFANYDPLTKLPNRRFFFETLQRFVTESERNTKNFALLYIDLDAFKEINDTYGHEVGDATLVTLGNRLLKCIRETDFASRLGGDEFAVLVHEVEDKSTALLLAKRIHMILQDIISLDAIECSVNCSIGIAIYPDHGNTSETLVRNADSAMYEIKRKRTGGIGMYLDPTQQ